MLIPMGGIILIGALISAVVAGFLGVTIALIEKFYKSVNQ